jgi:hypothetical protein
LQMGINRSLLASANFDHRHSKYHLIIPPLEANIKSVRGFIPFANLKIIEKAARRM